MSDLRLRVLRRYKELLYMGRDYPQGYVFFRDRLHRAFKSKAGLTDHAQIERQLAFTDYIEREIEALYQLRKYRTIKRNYYADER
ncbi:uncharacterized protein V1510DRAFT_417036 [Dipodascopsis tothii]|uniref:uncharacterized protein n=1 Tax=Dipodascopsis tothii TaxID=44089 RepID=UPI0034CEFD7E